MNLLPGKVQQCHFPSPFFVIYNWPPVNLENISRDFILFFFLLIHWTKFEVFITFFPERYIKMYCNVNKVNNATQRSPTQRRGEGKLFVFRWRHRRRRETISPFFDWSEGKQVPKVTLGTGYH